MADKFFKLTCNKKVSHKAVKESGNLEPVILFIKASTQKQAKTEAESMIEAKHPLCTDFEHKYGECFKGAIVEAISEEDYNIGIISEECTYGLDHETPCGEFQETIPDKPYPELGNDGFYSEESAEISNFILDSSTENMKAAKIFVLNVGHRQWAHGYKMKCGSSVQHEQMNLDRTEETRLLAIDSAEKDLKQKANGKYEFGDDPNQKPFYSSVMEHDFAYDLLEPSENFIRAIKKHRDFENAVMEHSDYAEVVESHFADIWPLDKSPEQAIEHINSMVTISVLYDLEAFTESFKPYLPSVFSEKTKESMKHIEEVIDKPAANDSEVEPRCWKAALPVTDELHVVIAIQDRGDEGWQHAFEGNLKTERVFGDANDFSGEFAVTRKEAIKMAGQAITDALYKYDSSLSLAKLFMKTPYIQGFEESCIEVTVGEDVAQSECSPIETAIRERLARRPTASMTEAEVKLALDSIMPHVTEQTNIEALIEAIGSVERAGVMFDKKTMGHLVAECTTATNSQPKEPTHNPENEHECFIAEILSRIGDEGSSFLTSAQYEEAGEKLATVIDELTNWYDGEREHDGKRLIFVKDETLKNIADTDFDDASEVSKTFLNIRSLRAAFRENIELIESSKPTSELVDATQKPEVKHPALLQAITERLENESHAVTPERAYTHLLKIITKNTDIDGLAEYIKQLKNPVIIWHSTESVNLVMMFTNQNQNNGNNEPTSGNDEPEPPQNLPKQGESEPKVTSNERKVTKQEPLPQPANDELIADSDGDANGSGVPQNIVEQEPANDPEIPDVDLDESNSNMSIWNHAFKTDLAFTKRDASTGFLSINPQYRGMKATEIFGSEGKGWGVDVKRYWIEDGMPILINGQPIGICESVQHMEIELWYIHPDDGKRYSIPSFGETERFYWSHNYSRLIKNTDCYKKSLTDAKGKALAMLGICGDVYMGEYDDAHIETLNHNVVEAAKKARHLEEEERIRKDVTETLESIKHELETVSSKAEAEALEHKGAAKIIALPDISQKQKAIKESYTKALRRYYEKAIDRLTPKQEAK
ncbi:hypothetical protein LQM11_001254 [Vibrio parahaemolyticus]|nr:hypothetical protein [Vibrio parahaemolyticus]